MSIQEKRSLEEIRKLGMEALIRELGVVGAIRFLQQFEVGEGDFTKQRQAWVGKSTVAELAERIRSQHPAAEE
jgi:hypothetical protein